MFLKFIYLFSLYFSLPPSDKITDFLISPCHPFILQIYKLNCLQDHSLIWIIFNGIRAYRNLPI